jgi:alkanesulfonate monooxygenase SsuD/methylene tetrahydromethanopterin reductase-like flavin-dependent oxidoreductase (luciferase family)
MDYGLFTMPSHPPDRSLYDGHQWDLQQLRWADELGFSEAWIGEHHTAPWEPHPSPDLLVAQSLLQTRNIRIGPGGFLMPYHHPAELANRVAMLDHMAQGRLNFGVAASGLPSDWAMFNVDGNAGQHREMTREALDICCASGATSPSSTSRASTGTSPRRGRCSTPCARTSCPCSGPIRPSGWPA